MKKTTPLLNSKTLIVMLLSSSLCACITMPGHRQIIKENNFTLLITAPNEEAKKQILFDQTQTNLVRLPKNLSLKFNSQDENGEHEVVIKSVSGVLIYDYRINGRSAPFDNEAKAWFTKNIPRIISKSGLYTHR